jgi:hypothetical protein
MTFDFFLNFSIGESSETNVAAKTRFDGVEIVMNEVAFVSESKQKHLFDHINSIQHINARASLFKRITSSGFIVLTHPCTREH